MTITHNIKIKLADAERKLKIMSILLLDVKGMTAELTDKIRGLNVSIDGISNKIAQMESSNPRRDYDVNELKHSISDLESEIAELKANMIIA